MKSALFGFAVTAALLALNVAPNAWQTAAGRQDKGFSERHAAENKAAIENELGLRQGA
jgi:hypothetical protein